MPSSRFPKQHAMRFIGRISEWNDDRGFGFVIPNGGGERTFVHVKAFEQRTRRPVVGLPITYDVLKDDRGRLNASRVRVVTRPIARPHPSSRLPRKSIGMLFLGALTVGWILARIPTLIVLVYGALSLFQLFLYGIDKSAARNNRWRTQESTLHLVSLLGGWPGALIAQDVFHHKSSKVEFQRVFWVTVIFNCVALGWLLTTGHAADVNDAVFGT